MKTIFNQSKVPNTGSTPATSPIILKTGHLAVWSYYCQIPVRKVCIKRLDHHSKYSSLTDLLKCFLKVTPTEFRELPRWSNDERFKPTISLLLVKIGYSLGESFFMPFGRVNINSNV